MQQDYKKSYSELLELDAKHIWHPYTQAKIAPQPLMVKSAKAEFLYVIDEDGKEKKIIDGISSWWVNIHGHAHPYINQRIKEQLDQMEHVIFAGFTHEPAIELVNKLLPLLPSFDINSAGLETIQDFSQASLGKQVLNKSRLLSKAFFSDNGSTAVEVAIKMAIQYWHNLGETQKTRIIAFKDSYHGDTIGAMSSSDTPVFHQAFKKILFPVHFVDSPSVPRYPSQENPSEVEQYTIGDKLSYKNNTKEHELKVLSQIEKLIVQEYKDEIAAVLIEPLVQGAGGMKFHSPEFLQKLRKLCDHYQVILIADEVFVGFGRTGADFACKKAMIVPDIICLSKGLTAGYLPMGLSITSKEIYSAFHSDSRMKTFFHGHSFTGNPLACSAALASLDLYIGEERLKDVQYINQCMEKELNCFELWDLDIVHDIRIIGGLAVIELKKPNSKAESNYLSELGPLLSAEFLKRHILLRPLGNILYFLPPYTITVKSLNYVLNAIKEVLIIARHS